VTHVGAGRSASDWVRAALVFEGTPVSEVARVIERDYRTPVRVADEAVGSRTVSAWFAEQPGLEELLWAVCRAVDATCSIQDSGAVIAR
jgi:ferric-dicitrate binding protein FerR (iron transport regulator)